MKEVRTLKHLQTMLTLHTEKMEQSKLEVKLKQKEFSEQIKIVDDLKNQIANLKSSSTNLKVSEHALLRYFERIALGRDMCAP